MTRRAAPTRRSAEHAWLLTGPLAAYSVVCAVFLGLRSPEWPQFWPGALLALVFFILANLFVLYIVVRRQGFTVGIGEIPLVVALYFLPSVLVVLVATTAAVVTQLRRRAAPTKLWYNVAKTAAATSTAGLVLALLPPTRGAGPATWGALSLAVTVNSLVTLAGVIAVLALLQGRQAGLEVVRAALPTLVTVGLNIVIGLLFLIALTATWWSVVLLGLLAVVLTFVYRSYTEFFRQHRTLAEIYDLTKAVTESSQGATLLDSLLVRLRALMQAEYATLHLPAQGRYPEVLLTSKVEAAGLLDVSRTPPAVRARAVAEGRSVAVGAGEGRDADLLPLLRAYGVKGCIAVPLRSGQAVIGTLEVVDRLGDMKGFVPGDVPVLETVAAHAAVAVENSRLMDRLRWDARHDRLTGLPNRRRVLEALGAAVAVRAPGEAVAVLVFDVDGVREVNESTGYATGDRLLAEVGERLRAGAGSAALVGRIGGGAFAVTLRVERVEAAAELAARLRGQIRGPVTVGPYTLDVDAVAGVAVQPDHGDDPEVLLQRADLAARAAAALPDGVQVFHPALESRATHRLNLAADLRRALDAGEVEVHFQPEVRLADRYLVGVECLARWQHPVHGEVPAEEFVAVAERTGQIGRLTETVLTAGLRRCRSWADQERPLAIAVNVSARSLLDPQFPDQVARLLAEYAVAPGQLTVEISEPDLPGDPGRVLPALTRLRELGVRLSVDDFGTGASALSSLRRLPVHEVKIDRDFVQGMATDPGDLAIVRAVIGLAREFGLTVVAEGVESELTLDLLAELGCEIGQGYLFSRPLPAERLEAWFGARTEPESTPSGEVRRLRAVI